MNLSKIFDPDLIKLDLQASSREAAVETLVDMFCSKYPNINRQEVIAAINEREKLGSTSMGRGVAFPHARTDLVTGLHVVLGICRTPIAAETPDGKPLQLIFLLLTPRNISKVYLQSLSGLANLSRRPETLPSLLAASDSREVIEIIHRASIAVEPIIMAGDIMTADPITIKRDNTIREAVNIMFKHKISGLPVVSENGRLEGEITLQDIIRFALEKYATSSSNAGESASRTYDEIMQKSNTIPVEQVMSGNPLTIEIHAPLRDVAQAILNSNRGRAMVISDGNLRGIITLTDIVIKIIRG